MVGFLLLIGAGLFQVALGAPFDYQNQYMPEMQRMQAPPEMFLDPRSGPIRMQYAPLFGRQAEEAAAAPAQPPMQMSMQLTQQPHSDLSPEEQAVYAELLKSSNVTPAPAAAAAAEAEPATTVSTPAQVAAAGATGSQAVMQHVGAMLDSEARKTGFMVDPVHEEEKSHEQRAATAADNLYAATNPQQQTTEAPAAAASDSMMMMMSAATTEAAMQQEETATTEAATAAAAAETSAATLAAVEEATTTAASTEAVSEEAASSEASSSEATTLAPIPLPPSTRAAQSAPLAMMIMPPVIKITSKTTPAAKSSEISEKSEESSSSNTQLADATPEVQAPVASSGSAGLGTTADDNPNLTVAPAAAAVETKSDDAAVVAADFSAGPPVTAAGPLAGVDEAQLFGGVDTADLEKPYSPPDKDSRIDEDVVMLPLMEENRPDVDEVYDHRYPDENKQNVVESKKEIHTYSVQKKRLNVHKNILHRHHKVINVNTDYITNVHRVAHPHTLTETVESTQVRHQPYLYVKHTRTDEVRDKDDAIPMPTVEEKSTVADLPPIFEKPIVQRINYDEASGASAVSKVVQRRSFRAQPIVTAAVPQQKSSSALQLPESRGDPITIRILRRAVASLPQAKAL